MRRLLPLVLFLFLLGAGESAFAARYVFHLSSTPGYVFSSNSPSCQGVADWWVARVNATDTGSGTHWWWGGACTGYARAVGDTYTLTFVRELVGSGLSTDQRVFVLESIAEDEVLDDMSNVSMQRVLVFMAFSLALCLGVIAGQQR